MLTIALKLMVNKLLRCLKKVSMLDSKLMKRKKSQLMIYADFESHIRTNVKNMLLAVIVIN